MVSMGKRGLRAADPHCHSGSAFVPVRMAGHPSSWAPLPFVVSQNPDPPGPCPSSDSTKNRDRQHGLARGQTPDRAALTSSHALRT